MRGNMKNRIAKLLSMALIIVCLSGTSSLYVSAASWKQNTSGWWYENDDGSIPKGKEAASLTEEECKAIISGSEPTARTKRRYTKQ